MTRLERALQRRAQRKRRSMIVGVVVAVVLVAGVAFAAWTASGSGSGSAEAVSAQDLTTTAATPQSAQLYPGGTGDLELTINNPNPYPVRVTGVAFDATGYVDSDQASDCTDAPASTNPTGVTFNGYTANGTTEPYLDVPAASGGTDGTATFTLAGTVSMDNTSANGCQGAVFDIPVTLDGASNPS